MKKNSPTPFTKKKIFDIICGVERNKGFFKTTKPKQQKRKKTMKKNKKYASTFTHYVDGKEEYTAILAFHDTKAEAVREVKNDMKHYLISMGKESDHMVKGKNEIWWNANEVGLSGIKWFVK